MRHIIVVGDMKTGEKEDLLVTHALGSCLGLIVYDPQEHIGGLLHAMLPLSKTRLPNSLSPLEIRRGSKGPTVSKIFLRTARQHVAANRFLSIYR